MPPKRAAPKAFQPVGESDAIRGERFTGQMTRRRAADRGTVRGVRGLAVLTRRHLDSYIVT
jgi:hypothetical protein